jgi:hypothetical protein
MTCLQNSVSPRFSTSTSSSSSGKWSNQMKLQEFATATIITITQTQYTTSALTVVGNQRARTKITVDLRSRQILELSPKVSARQLVRWSSEPRPWAWARPVYTRTPVLHTPWQRTDHKTKDWPIYIDTKWKMNQDTTQPLQQFAAQG